jgi:hypothetical protein
MANINQVASTNTQNIVPVQAEFDVNGNCIGLIGPGGTVFYPPTTFANVLNQPHIEVYDLSTSISLTATPTLLEPASTLAGSSGITYDPTSGVFTFAAAGDYTLSLVVNAQATGAGQSIYVYAEKNLGAGWVVNANSGKSYQLASGQQTQVIYANAVYRQAGEQTRYWIYSNATNVVLKTTALPGSVGASVPAIRIQYN